MDLTLLVIRTGDIDRLVAFYQLLGLVFTYHKHGNGPYHYTASVGKTVVEIYPFTKDQTIADKNLRIGFSVEDLAATLDTLRANHIDCALLQNDYGRMATIIDPDGRKIELSQST